MSKILGIDLGTTNSAMAIVTGGKPEILENKEGNRTTPSMVAISKTGERLAGLLAKRQSVTNPANTLYSIKRLIGRAYHDAEVQRDEKLMPYKIVHAGENVKVTMGDKDYSPQEISAMILGKLKADAEEKLGEKITDVINEPTAAALAYGFDKKADEKIAVYDLGGGTFDISILEVGGDTVEVKSTNGDTHLGGDDFDQIIIQWIIDEFKKQEGIDLSKDPLSLQRIKEAAEKAKIELSTAADTEINQPFITSDASGPKHLVMKMSRAKLEELVGDLVQKTLEPVKKALADSKLSVSDINEVVMVGGMTRMPLVLQTVEKFFGKKPNISVNPDEVVALGAAIQGGVLEGSVKDVLLLDVTPLTLGIETMGGISTPLIERNTTVPTSKTQTFSTAADNQPGVEIHVLQGEREVASGNKTLGKFLLDGIPPAPRGVPQIEVEFDIDANGILNVTAKDKATGKSQSIKIEASSGLSKEEIEKMKKDAEMHADEDKQKKELVEARNMADTLVYTTEKAIKDAGDKVTEEETKPVKEAIEELNKVKNGEDLNEIKAKTETLSQAAQKIGEKLYAAAQEAEKATKEANAGAEGAPVKEAEVEEEKKDEGEEKKDEDKK